MSIKPTGYPQWAYNTSTGITEPTDAKKQQGFAVSEKPPAQFLNWILSKQAGYIRYLSYQNVVYDDFVRSTTYINQIESSGIASATGLAPLWETSKLGSVVVNTNGANAQLHALGVVQLSTLGGSGLAHYVRTFIDAQALIGRDWIMEATILPSVLGPSGSQLVVGIAPYSFSGTYGYYFSTTGASGNWFFNFGQSGSPTSVDLGVMANASPSAYQLLAAEKVGATMTIEVNGQQVGVIAPTGLAPFMPANFGVVQNQIGFTGAQIYIDKLRLGVR